MKKKKWTNNNYTTEDLKLMASGIYRLTELASIFGVSKQSMKAVMDRHGIVNVAKGAKISEEKKSEIKKLLAEGKTAAFISRKVGVSTTSVSRLREEKTFTVQKKADDVTFENVVEFMKLREEGKTYKNIGELTGYSQATVHRWLVYAGKNWGERQRERVEI